MTLHLAAQYVRMSTERQEYSLHNQQTAIADYAAARNFSIVKTYSDAARSGLSLARRLGLKQLLRDVLRGSCGYEVVLVYDVSRWGRFQDPDESAHYEYLCRSAGIYVHYCAEPFENDGTLGSSLVKTLKRNMAGEFSRELGIKVYEAKKSRVNAGFVVGGKTPYGFRRQIQSKDPDRRRILEDGERKYVRAEKLTLVHGPAEEVECVRRIFESVTDGDMTAREIGRDLNSTGMRIRGQRWTEAQVHFVLTNPAYAGMSVWGRTSQRLGAPRVRLPPQHWIQIPNAFPPIISQSQFQRTQNMLRPETDRRFWTKERIIRAAKAILKKKGKITLDVFDREPTAPSCSTLHGFDFAEICKAAGYELPRRFTLASQSIKRALRLHREYVGELAARFPTDLSVVRGTWPRLMCDERIPVSLLMCPIVRTSFGSPRWRLTPTVRYNDNVTVVCCLDRDGKCIHSTFVFARIPFVGSHRFGEGDGWLATGWRVCQDALLPVLIRLVASRESIQEVT